MNQSDFVRIVESNRAILAGSQGSIWMQRFAPDVATSQNEMLLFLKPEITSDSKVDLTRVLVTLSDALSRYSVSIVASGVIGSNYLARHEIVAAHYGVINAISRRGREALSDQARAKLDFEFANQLKAGASVLGGHQFIERYPWFSADALGVLWDNLNVGSLKLAPGTYAMPLQVIFDAVVLLNGFHPQQLAHFVAPKRSIIVFAVRANTSWHALRQDMIGDTDPTKAAGGSLRRTFLEKQSELGMAVVNKGLNGIHLSAGPLEGMVELMRFCSDYDQDARINVQQTAFGRMLLAQGLSNSEVTSLLDNPILNVSGKSLSVFDATEAMDSSDAAKLLKVVIHPR